MLQRLAIVDMLFLTYGNFSDSFPLMTFTDHRKSKLKSEHFPVRNVY